MTIYSWTVRRRVYEPIVLQLHGNIYIYGFEGDVFFLRMPWIRMNNVNKRHTPKNIDKWVSSFLFLF